MPQAIPITDDATTTEISQGEGLYLIDAAARRYLKMSGIEFLEAYHSGAFSSRPELARKVDCVAILLPLICP